MNPTRRTMLVTGAAAVAAKVTPDFRYDIEQGTDAWRECRRGVITASNYSALLAAGVGRDKLIRRCASEIVTGLTAEDYQNAYMQRGKDQEAEALTKYALVTGQEVKPCGFVKFGRTGCSPDGLIVGKRKGVQIKTVRADLLIEVLLRNEFPPEHVPQVRGEMFCTNYPEWDIALFARGMPLFVKTLTVDKVYAARIQSALDSANAAIDVLVKRIQGYRS